VLYGVNRLERDVNHSPTYITEVRNEWSYTPAPLYAFLTWTGKTLPFSSFFTFFCMGEIFVLSH